MASTEPNDDEIGQVMMITNLDPVDDRAMVALALKVRPLQMPAPLSLEDCSLAL